MELLTKFLTIIIQVLGYCWFVTNSLKFQISKMEIAYNENKFVKGLCSKQTDKIWWKDIFYLNFTKRIFHKFAQSK